MFMKKFILILILTIFLTGCSGAKENYTSVKQDNINNSASVNQDMNEDKYVDESIQENDINNNDINNNDSDQKENTSSNNDVNNTSKDDNKPNEEVIYSTKDITVINKIEEIDTEVDNLLLKDKSEDSKSKVKGIFITLVDFVFYDGKIKGITFDELTEKGQEKVLSLINKIDEKIEKHFPNYKENITDKTKNAFNKASELIKKGSENIKNFSKEMLGEEYYQDIINAKDEFVKYTKDALSLLKDVGSSLFESIKDKLSDWYNNFKNNN